MEKKWIFIIGILVVMILTAIAIFGITSMTGSVIYGKCWNTEKQIGSDSELLLKMQGCILDRANSKVCCPFDYCPESKDVKCGP
ncbi:MAG: hypothetical protein PHC66_02145 [Candidatus Nanoarchaeia archaeon]|nr:hypothetical protein [Candidatus Nanoarchaeia archaeon]MDD5239726.1 hypothetical protein [Candidatus Nanoarchaeia archaeon]